MRLLHSFIIFFFISLSMNYYVIIFRKELFEKYKFSLMKAKNNNKCMIKEILKCLWIFLYVTSIKLMSFLNSFPFDVR